jgi:hypothetical protein
MIGPLSPDTLITCPLDRRTALVGVFDGPAAAWTLDRDGVAGLNSATLMTASQIYSPTSDFIWAQRDNTLGNADDLMAAWAAQKPE